MTLICASSTQYEWKVVKAEEKREITISGCLPSTSSRLVNWERGNLKSVGGGNNSNLLYDDSVA